MGFARSVLWELGLRKKRDPGNGLLDQRTGFALTMVRQDPGFSFPHMLASGMGTQSATVHLIFRGYWKRREGVGLMPRQFGLWAQVMGDSLVTNEGKRIRRGSQACRRWIQLQEISREVI